MDSILPEKIAIDLDRPRPEDGYAVNKLISECPPLDTNSVYCNLLQCTHFSRTSICAKREGQVVGFISGYLLPEKSDTLFVWQVAVSESVRGRGLASQMLEKLLGFPELRKIKYLETTITESNEASWSLFLRLAKKFSAETDITDYFTKDTHFHGQHETEKLLRIGPFH